MEVTVFYIRLLLMVSMQLGVRSQMIDPALLIIPSKLQLFEFESLSVQCSSVDGVTGWAILRKTKKSVSACGSLMWGTLVRSSCTIKGAFSEDSGEYWCEAGGGKRSDSVHITVTAGSVVLESPVLPVMEGEAVELRCRPKNESSDLTTDFYKNGLHVGRSSTREMTIPSVSVCDQGIYTCKIRDGSPGSWLYVRAKHEELRPSSGLVFVVFRNIFPVLMMIPLLLLLAALHRGKFRCRQN
ncbi:high affinity immunoglobulin gamma Fc receptor I-like [Xyrichtys novacula]|nr:high affinity immunoglobulin gamma Fc receptor I-like [Xyrichtys novacula]